MFSWAWNIMFTDYQKVLVLNFSERKDTVFFWAKKLIELYLLITKKFLFWTFWEWEIRSFLRQKVDGNIFTGYWKVLVLTFSGIGNTGVFFCQKFDVKMIFTWFFLAFHDISGPRKYGFLCSGYSLSKP